MRAALGLLAFFLPALASAQDQTMTFRAVAPHECKTNCAPEIVAEGTITRESAREFQSAFAKLGLARPIVRLNSPGGNLIAGIELGEALRQAGATTVVGKGSRCVSACVYAFLGGTERRVSSGSIGVHNFRPDGSASVDDFPDALVQQAITMLSDYVRRMGTDPKLVKMAAGVPPTTIHYLDAAELRRHRVVNR